METLQIYIKFDSIEGKYLLGLNFTLSKKLDKKKMQLILEIGYMCREKDLPANEIIIQFSPIFRSEMIKEYKISEKTNIRRTAENVVNAIEKWLIRDKRIHKIKK